MDLCYGCVFFFFFWLCSSKCFCLVPWWKSLGVNSENFKFLKMGVETQHLQTQIHHNPTFKYHRTTMMPSLWPQLLPHWRPCYHCEMPRESRHHCRSHIEIHVTSPISLLYDGSVVLDSCVAVNLGLGFSPNWGILAETYGVNLIFLDWWHKICYD